MMLPSRLGCPMSQKTPNMGNPWFSLTLRFGLVWRMCMYLKIIRRVVDTAVNLYASSSNQAVPVIHKRIRGRIDHTAAEHRTNTPNIDYGDPFCRIGYLYRHGAANANLFKNVLI